MKDVIYYEDKKGIIHACEKTEGSPQNPPLVWTFCEKDVPANKGFTTKNPTNGLKVTCLPCIGHSNRLGLQIPY